MKYENLIQIDRRPLGYRGRCLITMRVLEPDIIIEGADALSSLDASISNGGSDVPDGGNLPAAEDHRVQRRIYEVNGRKIILSEKQREFFLSLRAPFSVPKMAKDAGVASWIIYQKMYHMRSKGLVERAEHYGLWRLSELGCALKAGMETGSGSVPLRLNKSGNRRGMSSKAGRVLSAQARHNIKLGMRRYWRKRRKDKLGIQPKTFIPKDAVKPIGTW